MIRIKHKIIAGLLSLGLALSLCPTAFAANPTTCSTSMVRFVETFESYKAEKYLDQGKYYIGYGMLWDEEKYPDGKITQTQAEQDLKEHLQNTVVPEVRSFLTKHGLTVNQNQFDALCTLTYNVGSPAWQNGDVGKYLRNGISNYSALQIVNAFARLCHRASDKAPMVGLVRRRILEAEMFVSGNYTVPSNRISTNYKWLLMYPNGGKMTYTDIYVYRAGSTYGTLPAVTKSGTSLKGWLIYAQEVTQATTQRYLQAGETANANYQLMAVWNDGSTGANPGIALNIIQNSDTPTTSPTVSPTTSPTTTPQGFADVASTDWYYEAVKYCSDNKLMDGTGSGKFTPKGTMTRSMLATVLWSREGKPAFSGTNQFTDVSSSDWYYEPVNWAYANNITAGMTDTTFGPKVNITREQMVTFLYRYAQHKGYSTTIQNSIGATYTDWNSVSIWAKEPVEWALENGLMEGSVNQTDGTKQLRPKSDILRCENAQVMMKFCKKFGA